MEKRIFDREYTKENITRMHIQNLQVMVDRYINGCYIE